MKARLSFLPGTALDHQGRQCVVLDIIDLRTVLVRYLDSMKPRQVPVSELGSPSIDAGNRNPPSAGKIDEIRQDILLITDKEWEAARKKFELIRPILETSKLSRTKSLHQDVAQKAGKHLATIYDWVARYDNIGLMSALARTPRADKGGSRMDERVQKIIDAKIEGYLSENRPSVSDTVEEIQKECKRHGLPRPGFSTIYRRIMALPGVERTEARQGRKAARDRFAPSIGSFPAQPGPLSTVQMDHTPVDLIFVDPEHRLPIEGRPTLTIATDVYSKMLLGFNLAFEAPSAHMVGACLTHAVLPKERFLAELGIAAEWPCWGLMKTINTDNAAEFIGEAIGFGCEEWGIDLTQRPKGLPNFAGQVERKFRTFMSKVHTLPGTTFSNTQARIDYDSTGKAILTLEEFTRWFTIFVTKYYHQRGHKGLDGMPPIKKWEEGILGTEGKLGIGLPERVTDEIKFRIDFLPQIEKTVQEYGIAYENLQFWDDVLRPWIHSLDPTNPKLKRKFLVKYDPFHFNEVYFLDPEIKQYFPIPTRNKARPQITLWEVKTAKRRLREKGRAMVNEDLIFEAIDEMQAEVEKAAAKTKAARRQRQRQVTSQKLSVKKARDVVKFAQEPVSGLKDDDDGPVAPRPGTVEPKAFPLTQE